MFKGKLVKTSLQGNCILLSVFLGRCKDGTAPRVTGVTHRRSTCQGLGFRQNTLAGSQRKKDVN